MYLYLANLDTSPYLVKNTWKLLCLNCQLYRAVTCVLSYMPHAMHCVPMSDKPFIAQTDSCWTQVMPAVQLQHAWRGITSSHGYRCVQLVSCGLLQQHRP
jgi:hypothetical protein